MSAEGPSARQTRTSVKSLRAEFQLYNWPFQPATFPQCPASPLTKGNCKYRVWQVRDSALLPFKGKTSRSPALLDQRTTLLSSPIHKTFLWHSHPLSHWLQPFLEMASDTGVGEGSRRSQHSLPLRKKARPKEEEEGERAGVKKGIGDGREGNRKAEGEEKRGKRRGGEVGEREYEKSGETYCENSKANGVK